MSAGNAMTASLRSEQLLIRMIELLLWRPDKLDAREEKFLRDIRTDLHRGGKLTQKQKAWLEGLYERNMRRG
jgi:hypothetical protein